MTISPKLFWIIILVYITARVTLAGLNYRGDTSSAALERALHYFSKEDIERGTDYHRAGFGVSIASALLGIGALLLFILSGWSARLAEACLSWSGGRPWLQVVLYLSILITAMTLLSLPFTYYFSYVIEHRFGFSRMTINDWIVYQIKGLVVSLVLGVLIGSLAYALLRRFSNGWVWMIPVGALLLQITMIYLFPRLLLPIFYKIEPIKDPEMIATFTRVTDQVGVKLKSLYLINESQYSSHTNAFFTGLGKFKEIYIYDTLLKDHTHDEIAAILAHELGHWKHNHVLKGMILSEAGIILACVLLYFFFPLAQRTAFLRTGPLSDVSSLPLLWLISMIVSFFTSPIENGVSRFFETQADEMGLELAPHPEVFVRDFKRLAIGNHSDLLPHPLIVLWRYSHPPIVERIEEIEKSMRNERKSETPSDGMNLSPGV